MDREISCVRSAVEAAQVKLLSAQAVSKLNVLAGLRPLTDTTDSITPDVFIIGAAKCGTSSLYDFLTSKPYVFKASIKEPDALTNPAFEGKELALWARLFEGAGEKLKIDASTSYARRSLHPQAAEKAKKFAPNARVIYVVRDPIPRLVSHVTHRWLKEGMPRNVPMEEYLTYDHVPVFDGNYEWQLEPWLEQFGKDRVHVAVFEELTHVEGTLERRKLLSHIGINDHDHAEQLLPKENISESFVSDMRNLSVLSKYRDTAIGRLLRTVFPKHLRQGLLAPLKSEYISREIGRFAPVTPFERAEIEKFGHIGYGSVDFSRFTDAWGLCTRQWGVDYSSR